MYIFDYRTYMWYGCILPILALLMGGFSLFFAIKKIIKALKFNEITRHPSFRKQFVVFWLAIVAFMGLVVCGISLQNLKNNVYLLWESEEDAIWAEGTVTNIVSIPNSPRYVYQDDAAVRAIYVSIDTMESPLYTLDLKDIKEGDYLKIKYLPQSKIVMSYEHSSSEGGTSGSTGLPGRPIDIRIIVFFAVFLLIIFLSKTKYGQKILTRNVCDEASCKNSVYTGKKDYFIGILLGTALVIIGCLSVQILEIVPLVGIGCFLIVQSVIYSKRPVLTYGESKITFYPSFGSPLSFELAEVSICQRVTWRGDRTMSVYDVSFFSRRLKKNIAANCCLNDQDYLGMPEFLSFCETYNILDGRTE